MATPRKAKIITKIYMNIPNIINFGVFSFFSGISGISGEKIITLMEKKNKPVNAIIVLLFITVKTKRKKAIA